MIFVANYKMNGNKEFYLQVNKVFNKLKVKDTIVLCPPFVYMPFLKIKNKNVLLGSQDIAQLENRKSTGQIGATMLNEIGVKYCLIGHSERREIGETDEMVANKVCHAQENNITPIVCVGEKTKTAKLDVVVEQVQIALSKAGNKEIIFAYEPVWAIGTGEQPSVKKIDKVIDLIKTTAIKQGFNVKVLYGGSVNLSNYTEVKKSKVDGFLMGGVSLKINEFMQIVKGE